MVGNIAKFFSMIGHPGFVPIAIVGYLSFYEPTKLFPYNTEQFHFVHFLVFAFTFILPVLIHFLVHIFRVAKEVDYRERVNNYAFAFDALEVPNREDRFVPLMWSSIPYLVLAVMFFKAGAMGILMHIAFGGGVLIIIIAAISSFYKISIHMIGMGVMVGYFYALTAYDPYVSAILVLMLVVLMAGIVGTSRLIREAHTLDQLGSGVLVGILVGLLI